MKSLYLQRSDIGILLLLVILLAALTFTLGVMVGFGIRGPQTAKGSHSDHHPSHEHGQELSLSAELSSSAYKGDGRDSGKKRTPSSEPTKTQQPRAEAVTDLGAEAGAELRKAYRASKQNALIEMEKYDHTRMPKSTRDFSAHRDSNKEWDRKPAQQAGETESERRLREAKENRESLKVKGPGDKVKGLFQRTPASKNAFEPRPGSFTVQVSSFAARDEAEAEKNRLLKGHLNDAYVSAYRMPSGETWYRVAVGSYSSSEQARVFGNKIKRERLVENFIVRKVP